MRVVVLILCFGLAGCAPAAAAPAQTTADIERDLSQLFADRFDAASADGRALLAHLRGSPERYLQRFGAIYANRNSPDPQTLELALVRLFDAIDLGSHPELAPQLVAVRVNLALRYAGALAAPQLAAATRASLAARFAELAALPLAWPAPQPSWKAMAPTRTCLVGNGLVRTGYDCMCGEPAACSVRDGRLDVRYDEHAPRGCDDCYPSEAICALPPSTATLAVIDPHGHSVTLSNIRPCEPAR